jgi:two-component system OmpR family sensor kinase
LISNAKKYSNKFIEIKLNREFLSIRNDGKIENIKNIADKYVRENKNEGGFGIGLYIVNKICKNYGFDFNIKNNNGVEVKIRF